MFAFVNYGQIWSWNGDKPCRFNVVAAKEADWNRQILFWCCHSEERVFSICKKCEGWMGGVWRWIFFSHGFQLAFTLKTVFKALDRGLHFVHYYVWGNRPSFVRTWSCPTYSITSLKSHPLLYCHQWYPLIFSTLWTALDLVSDQWANSMCILNFYQSLVP